MAVRRASTSADRDRLIRRLIKSIKRALPVPGKYGSSRRRHLGNQQTRPKFSAVVPRSPMSSPYSRSQSRRSARCRKPLRGERGQNVGHRELDRLVDEHPFRGRSHSAVRFDSRTESFRGFPRGKVATFEKRPQGRACPQSQIRTLAAAVAPRALGTRLQVTPENREHVSSSFSVEGYV